MEKLTSNRLYLDFNATSPLYPPVKEWLQRGDFCMSNPSSEHQSGRSARLKILNTSASLLSMFGVQKSHEIVWHSGATEAINTLVKGLAVEAKKNNHQFTYFYFESDHLAACNQIEFLKVLGFEAHALKIDEKGDFDLNLVIEKINSVKGTKLLNFTWSNNETGIVWDLELAKEIKKNTGCLVHIDSVQSPGKIKEWKDLDRDLEFYTFSGHKFGSLKGIGFTFVSKDTLWPCLIEGGHQQKGKRSGTENALGIESVGLALNYLNAHFDSQKLKEGKEFFEKFLQDTLGDKGEIVGIKAHKRNLNTIFLIVRQMKADSLVAALDMAGIDVGRGSACSSGLSKANRIISSLGYCEEDARNVIRISFSPFFTKELCQQYLVDIAPVFQKFA